MKVKELYQAQTCALAFFRKLILGCGNLSDSHTGQNDSGENTPGVCELKLCVHARVQDFIFICMVHTAAKFRVLSLQLVLLLPVLGRNSRSICNHRLTCLSTCVSICLHYVCMLHIVPCFFICSRLKISRTWRKAFRRLWPWCALRWYQIQPHLSFVNLLSLTCGVVKPLFCSSGHPRGPARSPSRNAAAICTATNADGTSLVVVFGQNAGETRNGVW